MTVLQTSATIAPSPQFRKTIEETSEQKISRCFQCGKCTNGCPVTFAMDIMPHRLMRLLQYGQVDNVLRSDTIWVCASCETCTTRCPNGIDVARVMDALRQLSKRRGVNPSQRSIPVFHSAFLNSVERHGRVHEAEMVLTYSIKDAGWLGVLKLSGYGLAMFLKGKVKLIPPHVRAASRIKILFKKAEAGS